ncbi:MAG: UvrD-helicase domain-containing protein, partial [Clostridia bacterium]|nr:UvrD-helicase domain-containing protein [Clostridia bacterium]
MEEALDQYNEILGDTSLEALEVGALWKSIKQERAGTQAALEALNRKDFDDAKSHIGSITFSPWNTRAKMYNDYRHLLDIPKSRRVYAKELIQSLQTQTFHKTEAQHLREIAVSCRMLEQLFAAAKELEKRFTRAKRERAMISFADLERLALQLLVDTYDREKDCLQVTSVAQAMRDQIDEIIVDEYQDTNLKQDLIFRALSQEGKNLFMVGDVKQSIYRFRAACPKLFLDKKEQSELAAGREITRPSFLYLNQNFRSHPDILAFANQIFREAMSTRLGQIEYDDTEKLNTGGLYIEESNGTVELAIMMEDDDSSEEFKELTGLERQADYVAEKIQSLRGTDFYDVKKGKFRPLEYGDMAVLCRVAKNTATHFESALHRRGVHCINNNQDQQFLDLWEIKMLRAFLQVINNPYRDIPLVTLLYSDFYCFTAQDLARIRATDKSVSFYDALQKRAETDQTCARFLAEMELLRRGAAGKRTDEVLMMIFARTHILERIASYPDGKTRVANMQLLLRYAMEYERESYKGLFSFLNYLDKLSALGQILPGAATGEEAEKCVHILSVHKSKGLEYPVCFLVGLDKAETNKETDTLIYNNELGFAVKMRDDANFTEYDSLPFLLLKEMNRRETLSEEMRVLYVALTRPKTHLYLLCSSDEKKLTELLTKVATYQGSQPSEFLSSGASTLKWLLYALREQQDLQPLYDELGIDATATRNDCHFRVVRCAELTQVTKNKEDAARLSADLGQAMKLSVKQYPYATQTKLPIKISVSEVKGMRQRDPESLLLIPDYFGRKKPSFLNGKVMGNVVGNAVHKFMQFADFKTLATVGGFAAEKQRLLQQEFLTDKELSMVPENAVMKFVAQPIFQDMITADKLEKEKRFFFTQPADSIFEDCNDASPILLQGVLDCYYEKNGHTIIVDYKTDHLSKAADFVDRYALQLQLYQCGLQKLTGKKVDKLYIYSFHLNEVIEI